jgi:diguanylate cyclase (GGDEF)-like protein
MGIPARAPSSPKRLSTRVDMGRQMISLRGAIEQHREELLSSVLDCCRAVVGAVAENGARVCPPVADTFQQNLVALCDRLASSTVPGDISRTEEEIGREIEGWGTRASEYYRRKAGEIRDVMLAMNEAAKSVADRDERYSVQFSEVSLQLQKIGDLEDLTRIKQIVQTSAGELRSCVDRMVEDGRQSVTSLKNQLAAYEQRLEDAERASCTDRLTGLLNRAGVEREIAARIREARTFCLVVVDLNGFKTINDTHGHAAGDELLKAFAREFKGQFRTLDAVGRWGGDEFVVLLDGPESEVKTRLDGVRRWVLGEYPLPGGVKVAIGAAIGIAAWHKGRSGEQLFGEADRAMYADKGKKR